MSPLRGGTAGQGRTPAGCPAGGGGAELGLVRERPRLCGNPTDSDPAGLAVRLRRAGLQPLVDLVCGQVKEVQVILHGVAVPQPISQADNSCENQGAGVTEDKAATAGLVASWGVTRASGSQGLAPKAAGGGSF